VDDLNGLLHEALRQLIRQIDNPQPLDKCGLELRHPSLYPVIIPFQNYADLNTDVIIRLWDEIIQVFIIINSLKNIFQSNTTVDLAAGLEAKVVHVRAPVGEGKRTYRANWDGHFARLTGHGSRFIKIHNNDQICLARAIVTAIVHCDYQRDQTNIELKRKYDRMRQGDQCRDQKVIIII
jgi:hypothetical protein